MLDLNPNEVELGVVSVSLESPNVIEDSPLEKRYQESAEKMAALMKRVTSNSPDLMKVIVEDEATQKNLDLKLLNERIISMLKADKPEAAKIQVQPLAQYDIRIQRAITDKIIRYLQSGLHHGTIQTRIAKEYRMTNDEINALFEQEFSTSTEEAWAQFYF